MTEISLQAYLQQIDEAIERGQYEKALAHGRHILQHYPKCLAVYRLLGKAMLEAGEDQLAADMFQRVLSGDPEDFVARVGMSILSDRQGDLQRAIWHMERAFELDPNSETIQGELRRLQGRRDGIEPGRVSLTRGALARLYTRGGLLSRSIRELRSLLAGEPKRVDLRVALAEALWRNENRVQAEEACLQVLDDLPYCLKANVLLGEIWTRSGREEGSAYLHRAEALDPENRLAVEMLGDASPLQQREVRLPRLEYAAARKPEERPEWLASVHFKPEGVESRDLVGLESAMETRIEIPSWLEEMGLGEEEARAGETEGIMVPDWLASEAGPLTAEPPPVPSEEPTAPIEEPPVPEAMPEVQEAAAVEAAGWEMPDWLAGDGEAAPPPEVGPPPIEPPTELPITAEVPDWLSEAAPSGAAEAAPPESWEVPDWLATPEGAMPPPEAEEQPAEPPVAAGIPDWLQEAGPPVEMPPVAAEIPDWLKEMAPPEVRGAAAEDEEIPDWLRETAPSEPLPEEAPPIELPEVVVPFVEAVTPTEAEVPAWLSGEELPSGDDALAWLESLAAGKEDELRAAAELEAEARMAEIMGRPTEPAAPPPVVVPEPEEVPVAEMPPVELPEVEVPIVELSPLAEQRPTEAEVPAWLSGEELPSGDDALAWLESLAAGKEDELRAAAELEAEARMAEIMGRPTEPAAPPPVAVPKPEEVPVAEMPPVEMPEEVPSIELPPIVEEEIPDWLREPAVPVAAAEPVAVEEEVPDWLKELAPPGVPEPLESPTVEQPSPPEVPRAEVPTAEPEAFGWSAFGAEEPQAEPLLPPREPIPSFGWTGFAEEAAPSEPPTTAWKPPPVAPAVEVTPTELPPAVPIEEVPGVVEAEAEPRIEYDAAHLESLLTHIRAHPRDYEARLALARAYWQAGQHEPALREYTDLLRSNRWADEVIHDMESYTQTHPSMRAVYRVMGDAYLRAGLLAKALQAYRTALRIA